jgi:AcrR family transcriptional regulator
MNIVKIAKPRGRPASFKHDDALEKAMHVFWAHGYEGASLAALTEAMGINKPSMYAAFGSKEDLFRKAVQKYLSGPASFFSESLREPTSKQIAVKLLMGAAEFLTSCDHPHGCLMIQGALSCGEGSEHIQKELIARRHSYESALANRFEQCRKSGDLPEATDVTSLAKYVATLHQGMSVQAKSSASKQELLDVVRMALSNWPAK